MTAYYNEIDPFAADWLRNLIAAGEIAHGHVDTRSIADVLPSDLSGFTQCHFFAGVGVWSYALRLAGWPDERPVWTGSCPCQPFSAAGRGEGFADERHLWPAWHHLIAERRPSVLFGEQVASKAVDAWIDLVQDDLEGLGYAVGAVPFPSAGVGAPHIRDRAWFVADAGSGGVRRRLEHREDLRASRSISGEVREQWVRSDVCADGAVGVMADADNERLEGRRKPGRERSVERSVGSSGMAGVMADANGGELGETGRLQSSRQHGLLSQDSSALRGGGGGIEYRTGPELDRPGPTNGIWRDADWIFCRDGRWRPIEPGTFPLAHGAASRVGRLRAYGNAINAEAAAAFIGAYCDAVGY